MAGQDPETCFNIYAMCTIYAVQGWCETEADMMNFDCAPACKSCGAEDQIAGSDENEEFSEEEDEEEEQLLPGEEFGVAQVLKRDELMEEYQHLFDEEKVRKHLIDTMIYMISLDLSDEDADECFNEDNLCTFSAVTGECVKNPDYMLYSCGPACQSCDKVLEEEEEEEIEGPGSAFGVLQITDPTSVGENVDQSAIMEKLNETEEYMEGQDAESCYNIYAMCTIYAVQGWCETETEMMNEDCAPACMSCSSLTSEVAEDEETEDEETEDFEKEWEDEVFPGEAFGVEQIVDQSDVTEDSQHLFDETAVLQHLEQTEIYMESLNLSEEDAELCVNEDSLCTVFAVIGECETNPHFMHFECAPACKTCDKLLRGEDEEEEEGPGSAFGFVQIIDPSVRDAEGLDEESILQKLNEIDEYMTEQDSSYCYNGYAMCTIWSLQGWCETDAELMNEDCAPACFSCEKLADQEKSDDTLSDENLVTPEAKELEESSDDNSEEQELFLGEEFGVAQTIHASNILEDYQYLFDEAAIAQHLQETKAYMDSLALSEEDADECYNEDSLCTFSAVGGECEMNPDWMMYSCGPACRSCDKILAEDDVEEEGPGSEFGVIQIVDPSVVKEDTGSMSEDMVVQKLQEIGEYMIDQDSESCYNVYAMCTVWSLLGWCESEAEVMNNDCAPSCMKCSDTEKAEDQSAEYEQIENGDEQQHEDSTEEEYEDDEIFPGEEFGVEQVVDKDEIVEDYQHLFDEEAVLKHLEATKTYMESLNLSEEQAEECSNEDSLCTFSAVTGECVKNRDYMIEFCAPACFSCFESVETEGPGSEFGVVQIADPASVDEETISAEAVVEKLKETEEYMLGQDPESCYNVYAMCTIYAVKGWCESETETMLDDCAPSCMFCDRLTEALPEELSSTEA